MVSVPLPSIEPIKRVALRFGRRHDEMMIGFIEFGRHAEFT
jgi:hypothetical protein